METLTEQVSTLFTTLWGELWPTPPGHTGNRPYTPEEVEWLRTDKENIARRRAVWMAILEILRRTQEVRDKHPGFDHLLRERGIVTRLREVKR